MMKSLPYPSNLNKPVLFRNAVIFILFIISVTIQAQIPTHHLVATNKQAATGGASGIGEVIWVIITLVFSYVLNYFIRKGEKMPEKAPNKESFPVVEQMDTIVQVGTPAFSESMLLSTNNVKTNRGHYKRKHLLQPLDALHLISGVQNKQRVAS